MEDIVGKKFILISDLPVSIVQCTFNNIRIQPSIIKKSHHLMDRCGVKVKASTQFFRHLLQCIWIKDNCCTITYTTVGQNQHFAFIRKLPE